MAVPTLLFLLGGLVGSPPQLPGDPKDALAKVMATYQSLKGFDATIVHHDDSGLFTGDFEQTLHWTTDNAFTLTVSKPASSPKARTVGNFTCDGKTVHTEGGSFPVPDRPLNQDANFMPGYEVSGGPIMSWLIHSLFSDVYLHMPRGTSTASYTWQPATTWNGLKVQVINIEWKAPSLPGGTQTMKMCLSDDGTEFVGVQTKVNGKDGYLMYKDQKLAH